VQRINLFALEPKHDADDPEGYQTAYVRLGPQLGASMIGGTVYEIGSGQSICPYHYGYPNEEWLIVLDGRPTLRHPQGEGELEPGDVVCFPSGREGAHKVTNRTSETLRVLMISTKIDPAVVVYPDSDKIGVWASDERDNVMVHRESATVDYWDREI
jgi:uncharacterized cupin superfamily protein